MTIVYLGAIFYIYLIFPKCIALDGIAGYEGILAFAKGFALQLRISLSFGKKNQYYALP